MSEGVHFEKKRSVLTDILEKCRSEVYDMLLTEYNEKEYLKIVKKNEHAEGLAALGTILHIQYYRKCYFKNHKSSCEYC